MISQSGETADLIHCLNIIKENNLKNLIITNTGGSTLDRNSMYSLLLHSGVEVSVASTKAYVAQVALLAMLAGALVNDRIVINDLLESMEADGVELPSEMDVEKVRERLHELSSMEVIPIPAKIGNFSCEEDILNEDADIYYIGEYIGVSQAHFCLTTLPIYYQARFREQARKKEMDFLNDALAQFESGEFVDTEDLQNDSEELFPKGVTLNTFMGDLGKLLNTRVIPFLLALETEAQYDEQIKLFYDFMKGYPMQADVKLIDLAIRDLRSQKDSALARKILELGCQKIDAIYNENTQKANEIAQEIVKFAKEKSGGTI